MGNQQFSCGVLGSSIRRQAFHERNVPPGEETLYAIENPSRLSGAVNLLHITSDQAGQRIMELDELLARLAGPSPDAGKNAGTAGAAGTATGSINDLERVAGSLMAQIDAMGQRLQMLASQIG